MSDVEVSAGPGNGVGAGPRAAGGDPEPVLHLPDGHPDEVEDAVDGETKAADVTIEPAAVDGVDVPGATEISTIDMDAMSGIETCVVTCFRAGKDVPRIDRLATFGKVAANMRSAHVVTMSEIMQASMRSMLTLHASSDRFVAMFGKHPELAVMMRACSAYAKQLGDIASGFVVSPQMLQADLNRALKDSLLGRIRSLVSGGEHLSEDGYLHAGGMLGSIIGTALGFSPLTAVASLMLPEAIIGSFFGAPLVLGLGVSTTMVLFFTLLETSKLWTSTKSSLSSTSSSMIQVVMKRFASLKDAFTKSGDDSARIKKALERLERDNLLPDEGRGFVALMRRIWNRIIPPKDDGGKYAVELQSEMYKNQKDHARLPLLLTVFREHVREPVARLRAQYVEKLVVTSPPGGKADQFIARSSVIHVQGCGAQGLRRAAELPVLESESKNGLKTLSEAQSAALVAEPMLSACIAVQQLMDALYQWEGLRSLKRVKVEGNPLDPTCLEETVRLLKEKMVAFLGAGYQTMSYLSAVNVSVETTLSAEAPSHDMTTVLGRIHARTFFRQGKAGIDDSLYGLFASRFMLAFWTRARFGPTQSRHLTSRHVLIRSIDELNTITPEVGSSYYHQINQLSDLVVHELIEFDASPPEYWPYLIDIILDTQIGPVDKIALVAMAQLSGKPKPKTKDGKSVSPVNPDEDKDGGSWTIFGIPLWELAGGEVVISNGLMLLCLLPELDRHVLLSSLLRFPTRSSLTFLPKPGDFFSIVRAEFPDFMPLFSQLAAKGDDAVLLKDEFGMFIEVLLKQLGVNDDSIKTSIRKLDIPQRRRLVSTDYYQIGTSGSRQDPVLVKVDKTQPRVMVSDAHIIAAVQSMRAAGAPVASQFERENLGTTMSFMRNNFFNHLLPGFRPLPIPMIVGYLNALFMGGRALDDFSTKDWLFLSIPKDVFNLMGFTKLLSVVDISATLTLWHDYFTETWDSINISTFSPRFEPMVIEHEDRIQAVPGSKTRYLYQESSFISHSIIGWEDALMHTIDIIKKKMRLL